MHRLPRDSESSTSSRTPTSSESNPYTKSPFPSSRDALQCGDRSFEFQAWRTSESHGSEMMMFRERILLLSHPDVDRRSSITR